METAFPARDGWWQWEWRDAGTCEAIQELGSAGINGCGTRIPSLWVIR